MNARARRAVSGRTHAAITTATAANGAWTAKIARHPTASTSGPPATRPRTGAAPATSDHHPIALARSAGTKACMIIAIDAGPVAAPARAATVRSTINDGASQAKALAPVATANPARPSR